MVQCTNGGLKIRLKKLMVQNVHYLNGLPSQVTLPFEYRTPILSSIQMNLVFGIQMVTVFYFVMSNDLAYVPAEQMSYMFSHQFLYSGFPQSFVNFCVVNKGNIVVIVLQ